MAKVTINESTLTDIGNAIRAKTGGSALIDPADMADEIEAIPSGATLITKSITANGTYNASSDDADGYSSVTVDVPPVLPAVIEPDISKTRFYDYDGTLLAQYSLAEIAAMTSESDLPTPPTHSGLVFLGWNWSFADIKQESKPIIIGANYVTDDGKHRFYVNIPDYLKNIAVQITINGTATVDFGDGTPIETVTASQTLAADPTVLTHSYATSGDYCISIGVVSGIINGGYTTYPLIADARMSLPSTNDKANSIVTKIELGSGAVGYAMFGMMANMYVDSISLSTGSILGGSARSTTIPLVRFLAIPTGTVAQVNMAGNRSLCVASVPKGFDMVKFYAGSSTLKHITIPDSVTTIPQSAFNGNTYLFECGMPSGLTSIGKHAFNGCNRMMYFFIPNTVRSIGDSAFDGCQRMSVYDFTSWSASDVQACTFGSNVFNGINNSNAEIRFTYKSAYDAATQATNIAQYASYMTWSVDDT